MRSIILIALISCHLVSSVPLGEDKDAQVLRSDFDDKGLQDGSFRYGYDTTNGLAAEVVGHIKNPEAHPDDQILSVQGSYSYIDSNGQPITVEYTADENGFVPREYFGQRVVQKSEPIRVVKPVVVAPVPVPAPRPLTFVQTAPTPVQIPVPVRRTRPVVNVVAAPAPITYEAPQHFGQNYVVYYPNYYGHGQLAHPGHYNPYLTPRFV